ncbi:MAG TPA: HlyD family efflux transporter periplasmic adaptor subunit [Chitinophagaceae bacterium]|jgi:HlyD family secretion protein|nr:HlyD family efflux transporter periplasmic adaptor subunit [Chitinophagaceae bacterium]
MSGKIISQQHELVSDEIQEVISYRPHWIVRRGNSFFLVTLLFLLSLTCFIEYPDIINASARIVALNPPRLISSRVEGKLVKIFVTNEQQVKKGQHLGYMESTTDYYEAIKLQSWIEEMIVATQNNIYEALIANPLPTLYNLGELQANYQAFQNELAEVKQSLINGFYQKKRNALQKDLKYLATLKNNTYQQKKLVEEDQQLQKKEYDAYELLAKDKVIATLELNQYKSKLIAKDQTLKQIDAQITNADVNSHSKEKELLDLQKTITDQQQKFHSALLDLKSEVEKWMQQYVLAASKDGKVLFVSSWQENELIASSQPLFYIQPIETKFYAELMAAQNGLGKIRAGQKVMLKVESYPSNEFGYVAGVVNYISNVPNRRDSFLITVDLPKALKTNYNKTIFFRNNLSARAEIITDDRKLFDRLTGQLKQIWER